MSRVYWTNRVACLLVLMFLWPSCSGSSLSGRQHDRTGELTSTYQKLERLSYKIATEGATPADDAELWQIRNFYLSQSEAAGKFLIQRLKVITKEEEEFLGGSQDPLRAVEYIVYLHDHGRSHGVKYEVANILADMYRRLSKDARSEALEAIMDSYTPSSYGREDLQELHSAMLRVGPDSVPYLLRLANHPNQNVRCSVSSGLNSLFQELLGTSKEGRGSGAPPNLDCHAEEKARERAIQGWRIWWEEFGSKLPFPSLPSAFDTENGIQPKGARRAPGK